MNTSDLSTDASHNNTSGRVSSVLGVSSNSVITGGEELPLGVADSVQRVKRYIGKLAEDTYNKYSTFLSEQAQLQAQLRLQQEHPPASTTPLLPVQQQAAKEDRSNATEDTQSPIKICIDTVQQATEEGHYEKAVDCLKTYYRDYFCTQEVEDVYIELLEFVEQKLKTVINKKKDIAVQEERLSDVERFSALYSGLGMREEGIATFKTHYLEKIIKIESESILELLSSFLAKQKEPPSNTNEQPEEKEEGLLDFTDSIHKLYEFLAVFIDEKQSFIEQYFGADAFKQIVDTMQHQCDKYSSKVLQTFVEHFSIMELMVKVNMQKMADPQEANSEETAVDPRQLTSLLDQMAFLIQCNELFDKFIKSKVPTLNPQKPYQRQQFTKEITMYYNILEEYFMLASSKKAIRLDKREDGNSKTSSIVDNLFFVLKRCSLRALSTNNSNSACSIINMLSNILSIDYRQVLDNRLEYAFSTIVPDSDHLNPLVLLNNIEVSVDYTSKLAIELESECQKMFKESPKELEKISTCLAELHNIAKSFKEEILMNYLSRVCSKLYSRVSQSLESCGIAHISYELDEVKFVANEVNDPYVSQFIADLSEMFSPFKVAFTDSNYAHFIETIVGSVSKDLEFRLASKKFTLLGGLQLEKELKELIDFFTAEAQRSARSKFSRLTQMASLLNLEKLSDFTDIWINSNVKWKITEQEARMYLKKRTDFHAEEVDKLQLHMPK